MTSPWEARASSRAGAFSRVKPDTDPATVNTARPCLASKASRIVSSEGSRAASLAVASGANVKAVQRMLGHASAAMTLDRYSDLFDDDLDTLIDRMDVLIGIE